MTPLNRQTCLLYCFVGGLGNGAGRILIVLNLADDLQTDMPMLQTYDARFQVDGLCSIVGIDSKISKYDCEHVRIKNEPF